MNISFISSSQINFNSNEPTRRRVRPDFEKIEDAFVHEAEIEDEFEIHEEDDGSEVMEEQISSETVKKAIKKYKDRAIAFALAVGMAVGGYATGISRNNDYVVARRGMTNSSISEAFEIPEKVIIAANDSDVINLPYSKVNVPEKVLPFEKEISELEYSIYNYDFPKSYIQQNVRIIRNLEDKRDSYWNKDNKEEQAVIQRQIDALMPQTYKSGVTRKEAKKVEEKIETLRKESKRLSDSYDFYKDKENCYFVPKGWYGFTITKDDLGIAFTNTLYAQNMEVLNPYNEKLDIHGEIEFQAGTVYKIPISKTNIF